MHVKRVIQLSLVLLVSALVVACGDDPADGNSGNNVNNANNTNNGEPARASFETYNVGLARGFVANAEARVDPVSQALSESPADVSCLQEAWLFQDGAGEWSTDQIDSIIAESSETFPHSYFEVTEAGEAVTCTQQEASPLEQCVRANCDGVPDDELADCAIDQCGEEFNALSDECQSCVVGQIGGSIDDIINTCVGEGSSAFSYNGHNGLLLLSRHEMRDMEHVNFESTVVQRTALHAVVTIPEVGDVDLYCTHLAANLSDLPYPGDVYASYEEEQAAQINALLDFVSDTASTGNVVLMGDMNTGPAVGEVEAEFASNFELFTEANFSSPYVGQDAPECTFCADNTLIENESEANKAIDHVFLDFETAVDVVDVERVYDETQEIAGEQMNLSDHYGVRVTVEATE